MPAAMSKDIAHTEVTDHRILKRPGGNNQPVLESATPATPPQLLPLSPIG